MIISNFPDRLRYFHDPNANEKLSLQFEIRDAATFTIDYSSSRLPSIDSDFDRKANNSQILARHWKTVFVRAEIFAIVWLMALYDSYFGNKYCFSLSRQSPLYCCCLLWISNTSEGALVGMNCFSESSRLQFRFVSRRGEGMKETQNCVLLIKLFLLIDFQDFQGFSRSAIRRNKEWKCKILSLPRKLKSSFGSRERSSPWHSHKIKELFFYFTRKLCKREENR